MLSKWMSLLALFLLSQYAFSQEIVESHVDFTISPSLIQEGKVQTSYEWLTPVAFRMKDLAITDVMKLSILHPERNHMAAAKIVFVSKKSFDQLSFSNLTRTNFVKDMLNAVDIYQRSHDTWRITNKVRAYGLSFKASFDFQVKDVLPSALPYSVLRYLRNEADALRGTHRERILVLDMTNFNQLMYRNYSIVYMKELNAHETLIVSTEIASFDIKAANRVFNLPPISYTEKTMMDNLRTQIMHMVKEIQKR